MALVDALVDFCGWCPGDDFDECVLKAEEMPMGAVRLAEWWKGQEWQVEERWWRADCRVAESDELWVLVLC